MSKLTFTQQKEARRKKFYKQIGYITDKSKTLIDFTWLDKNKDIYKRYFLQELELSYVKNCTFTYVEIGKGDKFEKIDVKDLLCWFETF